MIASFVLAYIQRWHTGRANQRSMVPVRRIFLCNSMTP
jgi:hypothetical protein